MSIRIDRIELEGFINLYVGIHIRYLEIDFSEQKNIVCVIVGRNGSGKTSLLSYMTPFAGVGNLDVRDSSRLIMEGEKGRKRIVLLDIDSGNRFDIRHFYIPNKDGHTVKSYISVDGVELNPNGNVTSFKKLLYDYLGIEQDYLRLIRMGDNVNNLISAKSTERKVFMGKILDDVDVYLRLYKKMSAKASDAKAVVGRIGDEISKTGITDESIAESTLSELMKKESRLAQKLDKANDSKSRILYDIELLDFPSDGKSLISALVKKVATYDKVLANIPGGITSSDLEKELINLEFEIQSTESATHSISEDIDRLNKELDGVANEIQDIQMEIEKEEASLNLRSMREYLLELRGKWNEASDIRYVEIIIDVTKAQFDDFVVFLKNTQMMLNSIYEFGKDPIREVLNRMRDDKDIAGFIQSSLVHLEATHRKEKMAIIDRLIDTYVGQEYSCEDNGCPYKKLYGELVTIKDTVPVSKVTHDETFFQAMRSVYDGMKFVIHSISERKAFIQKLPKEIQELFSIDVLFDNIIEGRPIVMDETINYWMNFFTGRENYVKLTEELQSYEKTLRDTEALSKGEYFRKRLKQLEEKRESLRRDLDSGTDLLEEGVSRLNEMQEEKVKKELQKEGLSSYEVTRSELLYLEEKEERHRERTLALIESEKSIKDLKDAIQKVRNEASYLRSAIVRRRQLTNDLRQYTEKLDLYENLRYGLSNRTGLPLAHINTYFWDTINIANDLLDIVYDGRVYLNEPNITESDFLIPYVKDGIPIADVSSASQGETSFFNMAISAALRAQSMERYNIALYDEVDGAFDDENRQKTIPVLERQLEISDIRQAFLITHNQMFAKYPVDRIDLDDLSRSTVKVNWA